jgi:hypothetical protein
MAYVNDGTESEAVVKIDSSGTQIYAKHYSGLSSNHKGFIVDNGENFMYLVDYAGISECQIVKADAADGTINSVFEE